MSAQWRVSAQWRLFLTALRFVTYRGDAPNSGTDRSDLNEASRYIPVAGMVIAGVAGAAYWAAAQLWVTSVAVVIAMLATALLTTNWSLVASTRSESPGNARTSSFSGAYWVFVLLVKYNALMALSAATIPFPLPTYCPLGVIMIAAQAASRALAVSVMSTDSSGGMRVTFHNLILAMILGLAPATLLGIPGLVGLAAAILMRLALTATVLSRLGLPARERWDLVQHLTELCFYLGALASWRYV